MGIITLVKVIDGKNKSGWLNRMRQLYSYPKKTLE